MVDLGLLAVAKRRFVRLGRRVGVRGELERENVRDDGLRRAEGPDDDGGLDGLLGYQELDGDVLLRLGTVVLAAWTAYVGEPEGSTYNLDRSLARVLCFQNERRLQARLRLFQEKEDLVRPLPLAIVLGRQEDLGRVCAPERNSLRKGRRRTQSGTVRVRMPTVGEAGAGRRTSP